MKIYTPIKLNVSKLNVLENVFAKQRDSNSRYLDCAFFDENNKFLKVTGGDIAVNAMRADGTYRSFAGSINENGTVRVPLTNWMLDVAGTLSCSVTVYEGDEKLTTATFVLTVQPSENPTGTVSPDDPNVDLAEQLVERCEAAVEQIETEFGGAGIVNEAYTTIFETASVTTEQHLMTNPYVRLSSASDLINNFKTYKITFDGDEYFVLGEMWFMPGRAKNLDLAGNATLWGDINGFTGNANSGLPFLLTGGIYENNQTTEGLYLFTASAGTHTIKVELVSYTFSMLPTELIYGYNHLPFSLLKSQNSGSYPGLSVGENVVKRGRGVFVIGYANEIEPAGQFASVIGGQNKVSASSCCAVGHNNELAGNFSCALGSGNKCSGSADVAIGYQNEASEFCATAFGGQNKSNGAYSLSGGAGSEASGAVSNAVGYGVKANHLCQNAFGSFNIPDDSTAAAHERGNYLEIVGNGTADNARSNARTLDWSGNETLAGGITLGKGTADEVTLSAAQLKRLIALLS